MEKSTILTAILSRLEVELGALTQGARASYAAATDPDSKAENKYDTRTLEASYVARGQAQRVEELRQALHDFGQLKPQASHVSETVRLGSWLTLKAGTFEDEYFMGPAEGGLEVQESGREIMVITPASPLGARLMGKRAGDSIALPSGQKASIQSLS